MLARAAALGRALAPRGAVVAGRRQLMVASPNLLQEAAAKAASDPHVNCFKMATDGADPVMMTYRDFSRQIDAFAAGLAASKFTPKHKMVIWAKDTAENVVAQLGAAKVGVEVQVLGAGASSAEISAALSDARALLFSPTLLPEEGAMKVLHELIPELKGLSERADQLVYSSQYPALRWVFNTGFERYPGMLKFEYVLSYTKESAGFAGAPGGIAFSGPGSPTSLALPFIDPDAKMPEIEPSREVC